MRQRDGAAFLGQQLRHRLADDVRPPDHHRVEPRQIAELILEQHQAPERRARHEAVQPGRQPPGIDRVEAVDILVGVDPRGDDALVDMIGQRQLDEDAVDRPVGVERVDQREQIVLRRVGGELCSKLSIPAAIVALCLLRT